MKIQAIIEQFFFGAPIQKGPGLPAPGVQRKITLPPPSKEIKYTEDGLPYMEAQTEGCEISAWDMITTETAGSAGRSASGSTDEIIAGVQKGFAPETVALVRQYWAAGKKQAEIARAAKVSIDTVKKITPIFSKGGKP